MVATINRYRTAYSALTQSISSLRDCR